MLTIDVSVTCESFDPKEISNDINNEKTNNSSISTNIEKARNKDKVKSPSNHVNMTDKNDGNIIIHNRNVKLNGESTMDCLHALGCDSVVNNDNLASGNSYSSNAANTKEHDIDSNSRNNTNLAVTSDSTSDNRYSIHDLDHVTMRRRKTKNQNGTALTHQIKKKKKKRKDIKNEMMHLHLCQFENKNGEQSTNKNDNMNINDDGRVAEEQQDDMNVNILTTKRRNGNDKRGEYYFNTNSNTNLNSNFNSLNDLNDNILCSSISLKTNHFGEGVSDCWNENNKENDFDDCNMKGYIDNYNNQAMNFRQECGDKSRHSLDHCQTSSNGSSDKSEEEDDDVKIASTNTMNDNCNSNANTNTNLNLSLSSVNENDSCLGLLLTKEEETAISNENGNENIHNTNNRHNFGVDIGLCSNFDTNTV